MNRVIKIAFVVLIAVSSAGLSFTPLASAQTDNLVVEFEKTPLFNEINFLPGEGITRWVKVTNNSGQTQRIATEAINYPNPIPEYDLSRSLMIIIKEGATDLYGGSSPTGPKSLYDFYRDSEIYPEISLSDLANGAMTQYDFTISFPLEKENEWQDATTKFDILIGFQSGASPLPPSPPAPPPSGGGGGSLPPGLSILDESVRVTNIGETSVTIIWTTSYFSTSYVIYGTGAEAHTLDLSDNAGVPPKYGYSHATPEYDTSPKVTAHSVTITGLNPTTTYYFRAVSHASLAISQQFSFTTFGLTQEKTGETKGGELISPQPEGVPPESGEKGLAGEKVIESLVTEGKRSWLDDLIKGGLLAAIGLVPFNFKSILFLVLIIFAVLIILKFITKRKKEKEKSSPC